ncbi:hypothetical protein C7H19_23660 [Aphanothece hegewaldii CCALA 016]|uniref:Uncharacterized protein n=1 Tax=Aphanothece hegewaldii CCALA 016 TaxID=2107694 RepID=A0A2T1LR25_9CHRO|nr:hypothetical protein [Aphanothece hegewaldii]PSF30581.1 hypothetical protein C7H19_23660 [Aphanothece hegewaldii CCALA 016]
MPICPSDSPRKIDFYGFVPVKKNKKIRWKYSWELDWHEIEGDHCTLDEEEQMLPGIYEIKWVSTTYSAGLNVTYQSFSRVVIQGKPRPDLPFINVPYSYGGNFWKCAPSGIWHEDINGELKSIGSSQNYSDPTNNNALVNACVTNSYGDNTDWRYGNNHVLGAHYESIKRLDEDNPTVRCLFKIYDKNNVVLYEQGEEECPQVQEIPESCDIDSNSREFLGTYITSLSIYYEIESSFDFVPGKKCSFVKAYTSIPGLPTNAPGVIVISLCSPEDCDKYPLIQYICCDCKECPPNTCRIECGDTICCYDSSGNVVKSFSVQDANCL